MENEILSCRGIYKTYREPLIPTRSLQDHLVFWKRHRHYQTIEVLKGIELTIKRGEWVGIFGRNGCGKTTFLRILSGLMSPDEGFVKTSALVSSFFGLGIGFHPERTAAENIYHHGLLYGLSPAEIRSKTQQIINYAGVQSHQELPMKCYSSGMNLRVGFAAAAHIDADFYIMDEIRAVGDDFFQEKCLNWFKQKKEQGTGGILAAPSQIALKPICDRLFCLENGELLSVNEQEANK